MAKPFERKIVHLPKLTEDWGEKEKDSEIPAAIAAAAAAGQSTKPN
jgi:hypothetical protein